MGSKIDFIEGDLRRKIREGGLLPGTMIPSRRDLSRQYGVAMGTLERAVARLLADGTLHADEGRGTFVTPVPAGIPQEAEKRGDGADFVSERASWEGDITSFCTSPRVRRTLSVITAYSHGFGINAVMRGVESYFCRFGGVTNFYTQDRGELGFQPLQDAVLYQLQEGADGIVIIGLNEKPEALAEAETIIQRCSKPVIYICGNETDIHVPTVFYDNRDAGYQALQHLVQLKHRSIVFLAPFLAPWVEERWRGASLAVQHLRRDGADSLHLTRYPAQTRQSVWLANQREIGYQMGRAFLQDHPEATAIIAVNDEVAQGFLRSQEEAGKGTDSLSVISFDDIEEARLLGLTSLRPPLEDLGEEAARLVLRTFAGEKIPLQVRLTSHLVARSSTRPLVRVR